MKLVFCLIGVLAFTDAKSLNRQEFARYKAEHPEEFGNAYEGDIVVNNGFRNAMRGARHWTNGVVPYSVRNLAADQQNDVRDALQQLEDAIGPNCVRFVERTTERHYVNVYQGTGCSSKIGMQGYAQSLSLGNGCYRTGTIQHEFMHALGMLHEQSRSDRDSHVTINYKNIKAGRERNFRRENTNNLGTPYDYESRMHYGRYAFSKNGEETITPNDPYAWIGNRQPVEADSWDVRRIRNLYSCP